MALDKNAVTISGFILVGAIAYFYFKSKKNNIITLSGTNTTSSEATALVDSAKANTQKEEKEKADQIAKDKSNNERLEKEKLDKANAKVSQLISTEVTLISLNDAVRTSPMFVSHNLQEISRYQNDKFTLLNDLRNLGYTWTYPNKTVTKI